MFEEIKKKKSCLSFENWFGGRRRRGANPSQLNVPGKPNLLGRRAIFVLSHKPTVCCESLYLEETHKKCLENDHSSGRTAAAGMLAVRRSAALMDSHGGMFAELFTDLNIASPPTTAQHLRREITGARAKGTSLGLTWMNKHRQALNYQSRVEIQLER